MWLLLWACNHVAVTDQTPSRLELNTPNSALMGNTPFELHPVVLNRNNEPIHGMQVRMVVVPEEIASVTDSGQLRCKTNGNALVQVSVEQVERRVRVECRTVSRMSGPGSLQFGLGQRQELALQLFGPEDEPILDVTPTLLSSDPSIISVEGGLWMMAREVGNATLIASAGGEQLTIPAEVRAPSTPESDTDWAIGEGERQSWFLPAGRWQVRVSVDGGGPVSVAMYGANCGSESPKRSHQFDCELPTTGSMQIRNPVDGSGMSRGTMRLRRR